MNVEVFEGADGWRWRKRASNGEIVSSSEAFDSRSNAMRAARLEAEMWGIPIVEVNR